MEKTWTDDRTQALRAMVASGDLLTSGQMAEKLGVARESLIGKMKRLNLSLPYSGRRIDAYRSLRPASRKNGSSHMAKAAHPERMEATPVHKLKPAAPILPEPEQSALEPSPSLHAVPLQDRMGRYEAIIALKPKLCHWPKGDPFSDDFHFCCAATEIDQTYCIHHQQIAYVKRIPKCAKTIG